MLNAPRRLGVIALTAAFLSVSAAACGQNPQTSAVVEQSPEAATTTSASANEVRSVTPQTQPDIDEQRALFDAISPALDLRPSRDVARLAIWRTGWNEPIVLGRGINHRIRMWSTAKALTSLMAWSAARPPNLELREALTGALRRSENCRQRYVIRALIEQLGGEAAFRRSIEQVASTAGARKFRLSTQTGRAVEPCIAYLRTKAGLDDPLGVTPLLGTATWTLNDAVALAHALAIGTFGDAGRHTLSQMKRPKLRSRELGDASELTAPANWGAGQAFTRHRGVAYKGGWGGAATDDFTAQQLGVIPVAGGTVAFAVQYESSTAVASDDPGVTGAPSALLRILSRLDRALPA
ncbi:MAG: hypothetical protein J7513_05925 [Solirubrobacteraceae bacterium]|nr:hypothetical protein [Solirubrobacteraceae bacterium]